MRLVFSTQGVLLVSPRPPPPLQASWEDPAKPPHLSEVLVRSSTKQMRIGSQMLLAAASSLPDDDARFIVVLCSSLTVFQGFRGCGSFSFSDMASDPRAGSDWHSGSRQ